MNVFSSASWMLFEKTMRILINFISIAYIANAIGPEVFGRINYLYNIGFVIFTISSLGLDQIVINTIAKSPTSLAIVRESMLIRFVAFLFLFVLSIPYVKYGLKLDYIYALLIMCFIYTVVIPIDNYCVAISDTRTISLVKLIAFFVSSCSKVYCAYLGDLSAVILSFLIEPIFIILYSLFFYNKFIKMVSLRDKLTEVDYRHVVPVFLSLVIITLYNKLDQLLVANFMGFEEMGVYAVAASIASAFSVVPNTITQALFPKTLGDSPAAITLNFIYKLNSMLAVMSILGVALFGQFVIGAFFGSEYEKAYFILLIMLLSNWVKALGFAFNLYVISHQMQKYSIYYYLSGVMTLSVFSVLLIPTLGSYGAALSALLAQIFANIIAPLFINKAFFRCGIVDMLKSSTIGAFSLLRDFRVIFDARKNIIS